MSNAQTLSTSTGPWIHASLFYSTHSAGFSCNGLPTALRQTLVIGQPTSEILYYKPKNGGAVDKNFEMIWCETTGIGSEDQAVDPVADSSDQASAYRLIRRQM